MMMDLIPVSRALAREGGKSRRGGVGWQLAVLIVYWYGDVVIKSLSANRLSTSGNVIQSIYHRLAATRTVE
jgi:hypothetical protein